MNHQPTTEKVDTLRQASTSASLERRALLLRSMGKGSAVLAAATLPVHTLASTPTIVIQGAKDQDNKPIRCTISGMQSGMGSRMPATDTCTGKSPGFWHKPEHWITSQKDIILARRKPTFNSFFGPPTTTKGMHTLEQFLRTTGQPYRGQVKNLNNTDEWHWIGAWMNAMANRQVGIKNFPYTAPQIIDLYRNPQKFNTTREKALDFLKLIEGTAG